MLYWAVVCLIIAVIAGVLGFGGIAAAATNIAQILFFIFLILFVVALVFGYRGRRPPVCAKGLLRQNENREVGLCSYLVKALELCQKKTHVG
tara:strand:- start:453 stop:728 length:276 start_codon:yes stop_codon:yes gene_type:complete